MSDSLENMVDTQNEVTQPVDAVAANAEEISSPQADDVDTELYVETEVDQQTATNDNATPSDAELHARWIKEKEKRKRKNEELQREKEDKERIQRELNELRETVGKITKGAPPTLESCDYDESQYAQKMQEYYSQPKKEDSKPEVSNTQSIFNDDESEFYLYQKEQELTKHIPTYEKDKVELIGKFKQYGGGEETIKFMSSIAKQKGVDIAKAILAMNKNPSLVNDLVNAAQSNNQFAIADVIEKSASKVQTRQRKPIDTKPEPTINSSGPIDNKSAAVAKALAKYAETGSVEDYKALQAVRKGEQR